MPRHLSPSIFAAGCVLAFAAGVSPVSAREPIQDTYCLQGPMSGYPDSCSFSSYQQCMATASGTYEGCGLNPMRAFAQQRREGRYQGRH